MAGAVREAEHVYLDAQTAHKRLQQHWHLDQAAALASQLDTGLPCPVCGNESHPSPAVALDESISQHALDQAQAKEEHANTQLREASARSAAAARDLDALQVRIGESRSAMGESADDTLAALEQAHKSACARKQHVVRDREALSAKRLALRDVDASITKLEAQIETGQQKVLVASARAERVNADCQAAMNELPEAYREPGRLEVAVREARAVSENQERLLVEAREHNQQAESRCAAALSAVTYAAQQLRTASADLQTIEDEWLVKLKASQFADERAVAEAALEALRSDVLVAQIRAHDDQLTELQTVVRTLAEQLDGQTLADTAFFVDNVRSARQALDTAVADRDAAQQGLATLTQARARLDTKKKSLEALDAEYAVVGTLAEVACGSNRTNYVSFHRYVLGVLLDDVLVHATGRLVKMSAGRYQLMRKEQGNKGRQAAGLDLVVHDDYSGQSRPVSTLSGGESFMAALALALGLSDVVQAHAGGVRLETLFIDEGFGSLDAEALELAVATLIDLQRTGRTIGVISHVQELKEQLDLRVDITPNKVGSSLRVKPPLWRYPKAS
jgi:exonuclease SbcC